MAFARLAGKVSAMPDRVALWARSQGHDASHRTRNLDTHLTHGCIQLFRHFSRQRRGSATLDRAQIGANQPNSGAAPWQREGVMQ